MNSENNKVARALYEKHRFKLVSDKEKELISLDIRNPLA